LETKTGLSVAINQGDMMFNINIKKHKKLLLILGSLVAIYTGPSISAEFINITTQKQVSADFNKQVDCLAKNIYYESATESYEGKLAVAQVTMNRVNSGKFPSDICSVVYQKTTDQNLRTICQFSWTCMVKELVIKDKYAWEESVMIAKRALTEPFLHDTIAQSNALYYHAVYVNPGWNKIKVVKQIGNHIFYTNI
jgi:spore germination cell wall hydrolase CwlJ-like protein